MDTVWFLIFGVCLFASVVQGWFKHSRISQRRWYWGLTIAATIAIFPIRLPDVRESLTASLCILGMMTFIAYMHTPYIKLGGKIYVFPLTDIEPDPEDLPELPAGNADDDDPDPSAYGPNIPAAKLWWTLVVAMLGASILAFAFITGGDDWVGFGISVLVLVFFGLILGYGDGSWGYEVARGQRLQFSIIAAVTAGSFALLYLIAFRIARRWPIRREQSVEYRTHPRHRAESE